MGTTKDPEGFRRHSSGRRQVLGARAGEEARRSGCGLGAVLLLVGLAVGVAALSLDRERGTAPGGVAAEPAQAASAGEQPVDVGELAADGRREVRGAGEARVEPASAEHRPARAPWSTRVPPSPATLPLELLRGWSDMPLAGAELYWIGRDDLARMRREGLTVTTVALEPVLRAHGRRARSDESGRVLVAADGCHLLVLDEVWTRELEVRPSAAGPTRVRVFAPRDLAVEVVDWRGRPAPGIPVELWRVDADGVPTRRLLSVRTSTATGVMRLEDADMLLQSEQERYASSLRRQITGEQGPDDPPALDPTRLRILLERDLAPEAWAEVDLARDPLPPVRLQLPPLGELRVVVADAAGVPVAWSGRVELRVDGQDGPPLRGELAGGTTTFANLRLARALHARAVRADGARGEELALAPLTSEEPEREIALADVPAAPRLRVRPIHPDGFALPRTWMNVHIRARRDPIEGALADFTRRQLLEQSLGDLGAHAGPPPEPPPEPESEQWRHSLLTDASGTIDLPMPDTLLVARTGTLVVSVVREGRSLSTEPMRLDRGEGWRDLDLGPVPFGER